MVFVIGSPAANMFRIARLSLGTVLDKLPIIPLGIPRAGRGKGIVVTGFSLISRYPRAACDSQPPPPNKLSAGGWELKGRRQMAGR